MKLSRHFKIFLLTLIAATLPQLANAYDFMVDGLCYNYNSDGTSVTVTYEIASYPNGYSNLSGDLVIPYSVNNNGSTYLVTSIGSAAFRNCTDLISLTISNSVTSIGYGAFSGCSGLTSVTIPNSLQTVAENAFNDCRGLSSVNITDFVVWCNIDFNSYDSNPLYYAHNLYINGNKVTDLVIPNTVTEIKKYVFNSCSSLTSVTIPNSVTTIGYSAFYGCGGLTSLTIPNSVKSIGWYAFRGCSGLTSLTIPNSVTSIGSYSFYGCSGLTSITIPNSVTEIGENSFSSCTSLTSVVLDCNSIVSKNYSSTKNLRNIFGSQVKEYIIGNSVMKIGEYAFYDCLNLTSLVIGSSVTSIGNKAFGGSYSSANHLTTITLNCNSIVSKNYTPSSNILNIFGSQVKDYIIGDSVKKIGNYAFFRGALTSATIGNSVTSIGNYAFNQCSRLTSVAIPNSVTSIGESAFASCWDLSSVTIGNSVNTVGHYAFSYCNSLSSIVVDSDNSKYDSRDNCVAIIETATNTLIMGCMNSIIPNSVTSIGEYAFSGSGLTSITIPNWVTSIGEYAFTGNTNLTSVTIGNSVTSIGNYVFSGCNSLVSIVVESGNPKYDSRDNCVAIIETATNTLIMGCKNSIIPNSVTSIGNYAFSGVGLTSVSIPNSVTSISNNAFSGCNSLTSVTLNSNHLISKSYSSSYNICSIFGSQVKEYILGNSVTSIGEYSFSGTTNVRVFNIPNSVKTIGGNAFRDCKYMYGITIPESIEAIGSQAFYGCTDLNYIHSKHEHPIDISLGSSVFYNVPVSTCKLKVPVGSVEEYRNAEQWNQFTNILELDSVIIFADDNVKKLCVDRWDTDFDGELSYAEAAIVNRLTKNNSNYGLFDSNKIIESFDELQYFTSLASLNAYEFRGCVNLKRLALPKSIGAIGEYAFKDTPWLDSIPSENGIKYYDNIAIAYDGETHDVSFKNDTRFLARGLFSGYSNIGSVTFPASISNIPQRSFLYSKIKKVIIPATIKSLAYNSFGYACIDTLIFEQSAEPLNVWSSYDDPFGTFSYAELGFVNISRQLVENLQYTVSYDEQYGKTFGKASISKAIITDDFDLTSMFDGCNLNDVEFPENMTIIGDYAFRKYRNNYYYYFDYSYDLTDVIIPQKVTSIGTEAFFCYLQSLTLPNSVKSIGEKAFYSSNMKNIYSYIKEPATVTLGSNIFWDVNTSTCVLHVPKGKVGLYRTADQWKDFVNIVEMENAVLGDVNADGVVTAADVTALYDYMLNNDNSHIVNGDQNGDGNITAADVTAVYDVLLGN